MTWLICWAVAGVMQCGLTPYHTEQACRAARTNYPKNQYCMRTL